MTDPREEFSPFWPQTVAPFGTTPQPPRSVSKHDLVAEMGLAPFRKLYAELERVYSTLNSGKEGLRPPKRPQDYGYPDDEAPYERIAEGFRAYLTNPNYFKEVAPDSAAAFRALVNSHPWLSKWIQFNSLGGLAVLGGTKAAPDEEPDR